eukprot:1017008-Rhodomonas_salina.1
MWDDRPPSPPRSQRCSSRSRTRQETVLRACAPDGGCTWHHPVQRSRRPAQGKVFSRSERSSSLHTHSPCSDMLVNTGGPPKIVADSQEKGVILSWHSSSPPHAS